MIGGAVDALDGLQNEMRHRGQCAGIARADAGRGAPLLHQIYRDPHGGVLLTANCLAWRLVHRHDLGGGDDFGATAHGVGAGSAAGPRSPRDPNEQRAQLTVVGQCAQRTGNVLTRLVIAAHDIDGDGQHSGSGEPDACAESFLLFGVGGLLDDAAPR